MVEQGGFLDAAQVTCVLKVLRSVLGELVVFLQFFNSDPCVNSLVIHE